MRLLGFGRAFRCALAGLGTTLALCSVSVPATVQAMPAQDDTAWLLGQINALRAQVGVAPLALNGQLVSSATGHSNYLANNPWTDPHVESNGSTPRSRIAAAGYPGSIIGENVYGGGLATAQIAFTWWIHSPIHYEGMVNPEFNDIGIGIATGPYGQFFTTDFGGHGGGAPPVPVGASQNQAPAATHRPAPPRPTNTPTDTLTPSITYTPYPTATLTATDTPVPPTSTAIELAVSPQPGLAVALVSTNTPIPPTNAPSPIPPSATATPEPTPLASLANVSNGSGNNPIRTLLPFILGLQVVVIGGLLLRRGKSH